MRRLPTRIRRAAAALLMAALAGLAYWAWDHRHYWLLHHFREVVPGRVYAGGYQYPGPLRRIVQRYGIRTVLCLRDDPTDPNDLLERAVLREYGVQFVRVVIPFNRPIAEQLAAVRKALAILRNRKNEPVFVHCWGGQHRTGVIVGAYRARFQRWPEERIWAEFERTGGMTADPPYAARLLAAFLKRERRRRARLAARERTVPPAHHSPPASTGPSVP